MAEYLQIVHDPLHLRVDVARQALDVLRGGLIEKTYRISTSRFRLGTTPGSYCTPLGRFSGLRKTRSTTLPGSHLQEPPAHRRDFPVQGGEEDLGAHPHPLARRPGRR